MTEPITVYTFEYDNGAAEGYRTYNYLVAREHAQNYGLRVIANEYTWWRSSMIDDFTAEAHEPAGGGGPKGELT